MSGLIGFQQFESNLKEQIRKITKETLSKSLVKAVEPFLTKAATDAPKSSGKLARSMVAQVMEFAHATEAIVRAGPGKPEGSHGILMEVGTVHMTKRPFLANAYEATYGEVINRMENEVENG